MNIPVAAQILANTPTLFKNSVYIGEYEDMTDRDTRMKFFVSAATVDGKDYRAIIVLRRGQAAGRIYIEEVDTLWEGIKKEPLTVGQGDNALPPPNGQRRLLGMSISDLFKNYNMEFVRDFKFSGQTGINAPQLKSRSYDISYDGTAVLKESTVDRYLKDYAASNENYAQAYIAYMSPDDFLDLTTTSDNRWVIDKETTALDADKVSDASQRDPIRLIINSETGEVMGHEGRHRMSAMAGAGVRHVPVLLFDHSNKYSKQHMGSLTLTGQDFGGRRHHAGDQRYLPDAFRP